MHRKLLFVAFLLAIVPSSRAAPAPFRADFDYAYEERTPVGTHFWCVFPSFPEQWSVVIYARYRSGFMQGAYTPLVSVTKPGGVTAGHWLHQMMTVPPHTGRECFLVAYRNGVQQLYRGYTEYNPYGWHIFGLLPPLQALVVEIPANARPQDIANYQSMMISQWTLPLR
jgi:hypothetical protein